MTKRQLLLVLLIVAVASLTVVAVAALAHPLDNKNLPPTKARPDLQEAGQAGGIAQQLLVNEGRLACCVKPACGMCRQNGAACPCGPNLLQGKGVCGECWEGWQFGKGAFQGRDPKSVRLEPYPAKEAAYQQGLGPTRTAPLLAAERKSLDNAKRTMFQEGRYACCVRPGCDSCARAGGCPCGASLAEGKGVCGECLGGWHAGHGAFGGVQTAEVKLETPEGAPGAMAGHGAMGGNVARGSMMPPSGMLALSLRHSETAVIGLSRMEAALADAQRVGDRGSLVAALGPLHRELEAAQTQVSEGLDTLELSGRLQALEAAATETDAPATEVPRRDSQRSAAAAMNALQRATMALREAQGANPATVATGLARLQRELLAARVEVGKTVASLTKVAGSPNPAPDATAPATLPAAEPQAGARPNN